MAERTTATFADSKNKAIGVPILFIVAARFTMTASNESAKRQLRLDHGDGAMGIVSWCREGSKYLYGM